MAFHTYCMVIAIVSSFLTALSNGYSSLSKPQSQSYNHCNIKASSLDSDSAVTDYGLPPRLKKYADDLRRVNDDRMRYQQLLFLASKCEKLDDALKIDENKVQGCLSVVHVHATQIDDKIFYKGDSDAQLTKGLVALLVNGLSNCTNDEIQKVKPEFIQYAGVANSLTPGRNNGFLNMLRLMKIKAYELNKLAIDNNNNNNNDNVVSTTSSTSSSSSSSSIADTIITTSIKGGGGKTSQSINTKLSMLKPTSLEIINESSKHAGHAGVANAGKAAGETHFNVKIVAPCFEGLTLVQRHKMIYTLLAAEMSTGGVHALSISAKTPSEAVSA